MPAKGGSAYGGNAPAPAGQRIATENANVLAQPTKQGTVPVLVVVVKKKKSRMKELRS